MPYHTKMRHKTIKLSEAKKKIIYYFFDALNKNGLSASNLLSKRTEKTGGLWSLVQIVLPNGIAEVINFLKDKTTFEFQQFEVELDPPAKLLRDDYINFLNFVLKRDNVNSDKIVSDEIENRFVLIREILIRICTDALSANMNNDHDGEKLLNAMHTFILSIVKDKDISNDSSWNGTHMNNTSIAIATKEHDLWIKWMQQMVVAVKALHANKTVISNALNYLYETELIQKRHLLAELSMEPKIEKWVKSARFDEDFLSTTLKLIEDQCIGRLYGLSQDDFEQESQVLPFNNSAPNLQATNSARRIQSIITSIKLDEKSVLAPEKNKREHLKVLYELTQNTQSLIEAVSQIDTLNATTGWIAIITGAVKLDVFSDLLKQHSEKCFEYLTLASNARIFRKKYSEICDGLRNHDALSAAHLEKTGLQIANQVKGLQHPQCTQRLLQYIEGTLFALLKAQRKLGNVELIDKKVCQGLLQHLAINKTADISATADAFTVSTEKETSNTHPNRPQNIPLTTNLFFAQVPRILPADSAPISPALSDVEPNPFLQALKDKLNEKGIKLSTPEI